jgi:hypothetical protein
MEVLPGATKSRRSKPDLPVTERHDIAEQFYRVFWPLLRYANGKLGIIAEPPSWPPGMEEATPLIHELWKHDDVIAAFVAENPGDLPAGDLNVLASWRHRVEDDFWVLRYLKKHAVFLSSRSPQHAYGVVSLFTPFEVGLGNDLPRLVHTVLLPIGRVITYCPNVPDSDGGASPLSPACHRRRVC